MIFSHIDLIIFKIFLVHTKENIYLLELNLVYKC